MYELSTLLYTKHIGIKEIFSFQAFDVSSEQWLMGNGPWKSHRLTTSRTDNRKSYFKCECRKIMLKLIKSLGTLSTTITKCILCINATGGGLGVGVWDDIYIYIVSVRSARHSATICVARTAGLFGTSWSHLKFLGHPAKYFDTWLNREFWLGCGH